MQIKIAIIDDKVSNRKIIADKLLRYSQFNICLTAENGKDFLSKMSDLSQDQLPDIALMDLEMPEMDGVSAIAAGSTFYPSVRFVVLTIFDDEDKIFKAIKSGAVGYLLKDETGENIATLLQNMYDNNTGPISPGIAYKILNLVQKNEWNMPSTGNETHKGLFNLTDREQEILQYLVEGLQYKEIGAALNISTNTAKKHVVNVYEKLHVNSRAQALKLAYEKGLI